MSYKEPDWAVEPNHDDWKLIEIKSGVEVGRHKLTKRTIVLGRAIDLVDVPVHHESLSRQHARIAFDSQGIPWLKDLQSTHGTKVNKRPIPSAAISKVETNSTTTGSRGIMLFPGDIIQFGASTRFYTLDGPSEFERGAIQAKLAQQKLQQKQLQQSSQPITSSNSSKSSTLEPGASSWGISMDDDYDEEDDRDHNVNEGTTKALPDDVQIPEKYQKMYEKLNGMKYKLENLETESARIRRKGNDLTEGQTKQLQRNAEREETLRKSIIELEETLYDKLYPDSTSKKSKSKSRRQNDVEDDDEDDDFFDRTKNNDNNRNDPNHNNTGSDDIGVEAESEKSLVFKWKKFFDEQSKMKGSILDQAEDRVVALQERLFQLQPNGDEDAFFVENDLKLAKEKKDKIVSSIETTISKMIEVEKLLKIVNPKIRCDWATGYIGEGPSPFPSLQKPETESIEMPPPPPPSIMPRKLIPAPPAPGNKTTDVETEVMPKPLSRPAPTETETKNNDFVMPAPKRKRVVGPAMPPPTATSNSNSKPLSKPPAGTLSFLNSTSNTDNHNGRPTKSNNETKAVGSSQGSVDPKQDVWRAPEGQDGSGRTKLNEKFAGRY
jgi:pSer/pThr/pTyr-binding forkhead associated (FHA) protein